MGGLVNDPSYTTREALLTLPESIWTECSYCISPCNCANPLILGMPGPQPMISIWLIIWSGCLDVWISGYLDIWIAWYLVIWLSKYLDIWISGYLDIWIFGYLDIWISGYLDIWISGYLDIWISGYLDIWISGYLDIWISGYLDSWVELFTGYSEASPGCLTKMKWKSIPFHQICW